MNSAGIVTVDITDRFSLAVRSELPPSHFIFRQSWVRCRTVLDEQWLTGWQLWNPVSSSKMSSLPFSSPLGL
jgi:hypothetical protein